MSLAGNIEEVVLQDETLCAETKTVEELTYLIDRESACGGCEDAMTIRIICWCAMLR